MNTRMDRSGAEFTDSKTIHEEDNAYWSSVPVEEKLEMMTYLRECFYGDEATTGRLQKHVVSFISREDQIKNKKASGREKDMADAKMLEEISKLKDPP